jgi:hypothetical protein
MLTEWELWACANKVMSDHGEAAPDFIAERISTLTRNGDEQGVANWKAIEARYEQLIAGPAPGSLSN